MKCVMMGIAMIVASAGLIRAEDAPATQPAAVAAADAVDAASTQPTTEPTTQPMVSRVDAEKMLDELLRANPGQARAIQPMVPEDETMDIAARNRAVAPDVPDMPLKKEGSLVVQRIGRMHRTPDGLGWEFHFEADGQALDDPPMVLLPNLRLKRMETDMTKAARELRFRVTGVVTEYNGRNYLLVEREEVVADQLMP